MIGGIAYGKSMVEVLSKMGLDECDGFKCISIDAKNCLSKEGVFSEFSSKFNLPDYLSNSWDSFDECMADLSWFPVEKLIVCFYNYNEQLEHSEVFKVLLNILLDIVNEWKHDDSKRHMYICAMQ